MSEEKQEDIQVFTCENCGGNMVFDIKSQALKCPYCETEVAIDHEGEVHEYDFSNVSTLEEKSNWNTAKETIMTNGFTPTELESIDFNIIENLSTIRFAYVLYQDLISDDCKVNILSWQFDAKGSFQKMKDSEITTSFSNGVINLIPNENQDMIITNYVYGALNGN